MFVTICARMPGSSFQRIRSNKWKISQVETDGHVKKVKAKRIFLIAGTAGYECHPNYTKYDNLVLSMVKELKKRDEQADFLKKKKEERRNSMLNYEADYCPIVYIIHPMMDVVRIGDQNSETEPAEQIPQLTRMKINPMFLQSESQDFQLQSENLEKVGETLRTLKKINSSRLFKLILKWKGQSRSCIIECTSRIGKSSSCRETGRGESGKKLRRHLCKCFSTL